MNIKERFYANLEMIREEAEQLDEGPFGIIGKPLMKRKLKKQIDQHNDKMDDISWEGQVPGMKAKMMTPDQDKRWAKEYDTAARKRKALKRLSNEEAEQVDEQYKTKRTFVARNPDGDGTHTVNHPEQNGKKIQTVGTHHPYRNGGMSLGTVVAYENGRERPATEEEWKHHMQVFNQNMNKEAEQLNELRGYRKKKLFGKDPLVAVANRAINRMKLPPHKGKLSPEEIKSNRKNSKVSQMAFDRMPD